MTQTQMKFPITLSGKWQSPKTQPCLGLSDNLRSWLLDEGSLTARLKKASSSFRVEVLGEQQQVCSAAEACPFIAEGEAVLVREVLLYCDDVPQVFARSLLPLTSLTGSESSLANLGTQPLGQVLFNNPSLQRHGLSLSEFDEQAPVSILAQCLVEGGSTSNAENSELKLWGRRSIFMLNNKPLMVAEVFLPDAYAYQSV